MPKINLSSFSTIPPARTNKDDIKKKTKKSLDSLSELQNILAAQAKYSLLIILQGMDASGKDGAIKHVFSGINPMGCRVKSFKKPTDEEMKHDFLWRIHQHVPEKGMIQIFNRSHYEDIVTQRVHKWVDAGTIKRRYEHINNFEKLLQENNTVIIKFYLHVSHNEQMERLKERMINPQKMWKYNLNDMEESNMWNNYMQAYEDAFNFCSTEIPWTIIPTDKNWYKEYLISKKIVETLVQLKLNYPKLKATTKYKQDKKITQVMNK